MAVRRELLWSWLAERFAVAFVSSIIAAVTLFVYPVVLSFVASSHGGGGGSGIFGLFAAYYRLLFSKAGLSLTILAGAFGFLAGPERMATVFGFLWGTDPWWSRTSERLGERLSWIDGGRSLPNWVAIIIIFVLFVFVAAYVHRSS